ncbi:MAG: isoprenylcysteine carboxylmethyltransferase family protein, partial [Parvularculaceae bacterium]|nr:isoprenylcysteine carboxylmethyltransferase family protein [Parvularculaceae bacterium]
GPEDPLRALLTRAYALPTSAAWATLIFPVGGFLFAWWARIHLGGLWSSGVTRKDDHRIVDDGPYGIVRHPIYTGLLAGALGLLVIGATPVGLGGFALLSLGVFLKALLEERFLGEELGPEAYGAYRRRTPMLIPFLPA